MASKLYGATNDYMFKRVFGDERNKDILTAFLKTVLDIPAEDYQEIQIQDSLLKVEKFGDKVGILDIKIKTKSSKIIDVEMQVAYQGCMKERIIYYISRMIAEQMGTSEKYSKIQKVVSIVIAADHILIQGSDNFHHRFLLRDKESDKVFTNKIEVDTLELKKLPKTSKGKQKLLLEWLNFMKAETEEELNMLASQTTASMELKKAIRTIKNLNADNKTRQLAEERVKYWRDYLSSVEEADIKGFTRGVEIGEARGEARGIEKQKGKEKRETALKMLSDGLKFDFIAKYTELPIEEIEALKTQI
jgi:predicted transposase/invertase (TIGR01784 family)